MTGIQGTTLYFLSEWIIRLIMLVYVPQRRSPAAARTWLLLIFVLPWPGLLLYLVIGRTDLPRRRLELLRRAESVLRTAGREFFAPFVRHPNLPGDLAQAVAIAERLGDFPIVGGNEVEITDDYDRALELLIADIGQAKQHVHLLYYIFENDVVGNRVVEALLEAARRGVRCRVLIDTMGSAGSRHHLARRLRPAGVEVVNLLPFGFWGRRVPRPDLRNHRKIAVIDGWIGYVGSQNIVGGEFITGEPNEEVVVRLTGPAVVQLQAVFVTDRFYETEQTVDDPESVPLGFDAGTVDAQVVPSGPGYPHANNQKIFVALLHAASHRAVITTPYFVPDEALLQAMKIAALRGVEVVLVTSERSNKRLVQLAQESYYEELLDVGVKIYLYRGRFLHAKHLTIDEQVALVGSSNMDNRSFRINAEVSLLMYNAEVTRRLRSIEERRMGESIRLDAETWRGRRPARRLAQNVARLVDSLL